MSCGQGGPRREGRQLTKARMAAVAGTLIDVFITAVLIIKLFVWGKGDSGGHVLRETTSRGLCRLVCPSRTSERGGKEDCVKEGGGKKGSARGSVHWGCDYATALDIEVDPQRRRFGRRESDFALQRLVECRALETE